MQRALFQLGRAPEWHQTDKSTAAMHRITEYKTGDTMTLTPRAEFGLRRRKWVTF